MSYNSYNARFYKGGYANNKYRHFKNYHDDYGYPASRDRYYRSDGPGGAPSRYPPTSRNNGHSGNGARNPFVSSGKRINSPYRDNNVKQTLEENDSSESKKEAKSAEVLEVSDITGLIPNGKNPKDSSFQKLLLHLDHQKEVAFTGDHDPKKNYRVLYDPEGDKALSKSERKSKSRKIRFNGESILSYENVDPRLANLSHYFQKPNKKSKKFPYKQLPQPRFIYDKDSIGPPPQTELVVWDLPSTTSETYLINFFKSFGNSITDFKYINDPINAVPLGVATFKFLGYPEKSMRIAKKFLSTVKAENIKVDGVELKITFNDRDSNILNSKIEEANERLIASKIKRDEEEKKAKRLLEMEEKRKKESEKSKKDTEQIYKPTNNSDKDISQNFASDTTILSVRHHNKVIKGSYLPKELHRVVKNNPYIFINDKYVPTRKIPSLDIKRFLKKYHWTRIVSDRTGFFVIFNSLKECERCFYNEDGRRFFEYRMFMELTIPEGFDKLNHIFDDKGDDSQHMKGEHDVVEEATNILIKEFQNFLAKDIRERIIAPQVMDLLNPERYPSLVEELKAKEAAQRLSPAVSTNDTLRESALSIITSKKSHPALPSFRRKQDALKNSAASQKSRKHAVIPMLHALNYDNESDDSDEEFSRSASPTIATKNEGSPTITSTSNDEDESKPAKQPLKKRKVSKLSQSFLYESSSEDDDTHVDKRVDTLKVEEDDVMEVDERKDLEDVDQIYQATESYPRPVFEDSANFEDMPLDLNLLQDIIKDKEDLDLAIEILANVEPTAEISHIEYWAWKQKNNKDLSHLQEISEDSDLIGNLNVRFASSSGAFKSEKYRKIPDAEKVEYLPHRRRIDKPIKTVQHDDEESSANNSTGSNAIQSSRVNRANNRRFAADISAQKQMIGSETDILNLNALTKRKKPVSFARSAIHNWGLYALEPIAAKEMIIEYVGESIRQQVAEHRERSYLKTGIGSSYLFRIDENTVIDATKKGGIARFINHCCSPSCTAKIIKVDGKKRIVIYALRDIDKNEELTYDYKFERETNDEERIRCLCGAPGCKGYLN